MRLPLQLAVVVSSVVFAAVGSARAEGFDPERLAADLERRAHASPRAPESAEALAEAAILRLGLGDAEKAQEDAEALARAHGRARPDLVARVALARARDLAGIHEWTALLALLSRVVPGLDRRVALDDRLEAHALLGRALDRLGRAQEATAQHRRTLAVASGAAGTSGAARGQRGADAVAEARFLLAEAEHERARQIVLVPYAGKGDRESVLLYINGPAARWIARRARAIDLAEEAYLRVLGVTPPRRAAPLYGPAADLYAPISRWARPEDDPFEPAFRGTVPSPRWAIAAAARTATAWIAFVKTASALPLFPRPDPHAIVPGTTGLTYEELRGVHGSFDPNEWLETPKQHAAHACATVLRLSLAHRIVDAHTEGCVAWLSRNRAAEYARLDELPPTIQGSLPAALPAPIEADAPSPPR